MTNDQWMVDQLNELNHRDHEWETAAAVFPKIRARVESEVKRLINMYSQAREMRSEVKLESQNPLTFAMAKPAKAHVIIKASPESLRMDVTYSFEGLADETETLKVQGDSNADVADRWARQILGKFLFRKGD